MCEHAFVRWSEQLVANDEEQARLPGYRDAVTVRRFDAPEALETRFYEVRAKSVINKVPEASAVPFRWTINPYRGCSHACTYCVYPETPILLADGRTRRIADLAVGDEIIGTRVDGRYRRYVKTEVLAHWMTVKPVFATELEDGTRLLTSGDHRFLTERGWKHVTGAMGGPEQRPYLTTNTSLMGTGHFAEGPEHDHRYKRGYLCGMVRGDAHLHESRGSGDPPHFRLALADLEALHRSKAFLAELDVPTKEFAFAAATDVRRSMQAIRTQRRDTVERITELIRWPARPTNSWRKGFLAGIFDAEGSSGTGEALRIANRDPALLERVAESLRHFRFDVAFEFLPGGVDFAGVRIRGGLKERMRFFHLTDPAITRKRSIEGVALKSDARTRVVSVEPLGYSMPLYDITTGTGDFIADGVVSHNCFARPTHTYLDFDAGRDFEKEIVVKVNAPEVLAAELRRRSWKGEHIAMGTNTDPYQWVEGRYKLMRGIWEALRDAANPCSILTKSPLLLRDLDLMKEVAQVTSLHANLSVPTIDEKAWRASEPHTPNPRARIEAIAELNRAGIPCGILVAPLMPGINDDPRQVEEILRLAGEAGATGVGGIALHLRGEVRGVFMDWLRSYRPDLVPRYAELYRRGAYAPQAERERLARLLRVGEDERAGPVTSADLRGVQPAEEGPQYPPLVAGPDRRPGAPGEWRDGRPGWAEGQGAAQRAERASWRQLGPARPDRAGPAQPSVAPERQESLF